MAKKKNAPTTYETEVVEVSSLKPHPKNYRVHGELQLDHIAASITEHGFYRNVVTARDGTILAGHGVVEACKKLGLKKVPIRRLDIGPDDPEAIKVMVGDNETPRLGEVNDRALTDLLKGLTADNGLDSLLGTGFDGMSLANLVFVTRPAEEIADFDAAKAWVGLPTYEDRDPTFETEPILVISFKTPEDRQRFVDETKIRIKSTREGRKWATTWPYTERHDLASVKFEAKEAAP